MKIKALLLVLIFILLSLNTVLSQIEISIPDTTAMPGDTILVPIFIEGVADSHNITAFDIILSYDTSKIDTVTDLKSNFIPGNYFTIFNPHRPENANYLFYGAAGSSTLSPGKGVLVYFEFILKNDISGIIPLNFIKMQLNEGVPASVKTNGSITVINDINTLQEIVIAEDTAHVSVSYVNGTSLKVNFKNGNVKNEKMTVSYYTSLADSFPEIPDLNKGLFYYDISLDVEQFSGELIFGYNDSLLLEKGIDEDSLTAAYFDSTDHRGYIWHSITGEIDKENNTIKVLATHFSLWTVTTSTEKLLLNITPQTVSIPQSFELYQNYPNPFNSGTIIRYSLLFQSRVSLSIYNAAGMLVKTLLENREVTAGEYFIRWDGINDSGLKVPSGVYFYVLKVEHKSGNEYFHKTKKMVIIN